MQTNMGCANTKNNLANCNCTYEPCSKKGNCCECVLFHRKSGQIPACFFDAEAESTYDRSIENFVSMHNKKRGK